MSKIILRILTLYFLQFLAFIICKSVYSIPGDVDGNGHVEINDAVLIAQYRAGLIPSLPNPADADVNGDGKIDIIDALYISQAADGLTPPEITQINSNTYNDTDNHYPVTSFITINVKQKNPAVELTSATIHITSDSQRFDSGVKNLTQSKDGSYFFFNWNTRTLNMADDYGASVTLTDRFGQSDSAQLNISLGLNPPVPKQLVNVMDVWVPGRGVDTTVSRIYNVLSKDNGPLGYKWTFNYLMHIVEYDDGLVKLVNWDLSPIYFEKNPDGTYKRYPSDFRILTKNPDGTFGLKTKYGIIFNFDRSDNVGSAWNIGGHLLSIVDTNGNQLTLNYNPNGNLNTIVDASGQTTTFTYNTGNKLISIIDPAGRSTVYGYDGAGNLASVTNSMVNVTKAYLINT